VPAAPVLIAYLGGGSGLAVAEQAALALGNIAAEDSEYRKILAANGAIRPLAKLVVGSASAVAFDPDGPAVAAGATAAWALAELLRGAGPSEVGELMGTTGAPEALVSILKAAPPHLLSEAAWMLACISASPADAHMNRLVALGMLPPLMTRLAQGVHAASFSFLFTVFTKHIALHSLLIFVDTIVYSSPSLVVAGNSRRRCRPRCSRALGSHAGQRGGRWWVTGAGSAPRRLPRPRRPRLSSADPPSRRAAR
jgi:hypothetical protein